MKQVGWYMLFCFFWSGQFIIAMGEIVFAMAGDHFLSHMFACLFVKKK